MASSSLLRLCSDVRCTCMSKKPGITVPSLRSMTVSPAAAAVKPASTERMRLPSTTMVTPSRGASATPSIRRPAWISVAAAAWPANARAAIAVAKRANRIVMNPLPGLRSERDGFEAEQLDFEQQRGIRRDQALVDVAAAVAERGRDHEAAQAADLHAGHALLPALDDMAGAKRKREWLVAVTRAVEFLAAQFRRRRIVEPAGVVHDHGQARQRFVADAFDQVGHEQRFLRCRGARCGRRRGRRRLVRSSGHRECEYQDGGQLVANRQRHFFCSGLKSSAAELMQKRWPDGCGPSSNT